MTTAYFDSSAFVKLLVEETDSELAASLWNACDVVVSSRLAYVEVRAALAAAGRGHRIDAPSQQQAEVAWEQYWAAIRPLELTGDVAEHAGDLTSAHSLRGADAVHLASALTLDHSRLLFVAWDDRLRAGATAAGLEAVPATMKER